LQQLQTEANINLIEIPLHSFSTGENPHFVQLNTATMAVEQARFPLVSDEEITEINETTAPVWRMGRMVSSHKHYVNMETYFPQLLTAS